LFTVEQVQFGYIYGLSVFGCLTLTAVINLLDLKSEHGIDIWRTASVLGYSMLPIIGLAALAIVMSLKGFLGMILSLAVIGWSTAAATRFDSLSLFPLSLSS
jgi:protein YIPF5/7